MKRVNTMRIMGFAAALMMCVGGLAFAQGGGQGPGDGTGPIHNLTAGQSFTLTGVVSAIGTERGRSIQIDTGESSSTVYGFGPVRYWEELGVDFPEIGDAITVTGYQITLADESTCMIAFTVVMGENTVTLRDAETGAPLWRRSGDRGNQRPQKTDRSRPYETPPKS